MPPSLPKSTEGRGAAPVLVLWSPGGGRDLARHIIRCEGLPSLGLPTGGARVINHCGVCGSSDHGRPMLVPVLGRATPHLSISYAEDLTVVALTRAGPVGVDVERSEAASFPGFDAAVGHEQEPAADQHRRTITWVRKESLLKSTGRGLRVDPRQVRLTEPDQSPQLVTWAAADPPAGSVWMYDVGITDEHVAAITVLRAAERPELVVRRADRATSLGQASG